MMMLSLIMFGAGIYVYCLMNFHLLGILLSLEYIMLSLFFMLYNFLQLMSYEIYFSMIFMVMMVCEGVLGLSILVLMVRMYSNDYLNSLSILKC